MIKHEHNAEIEPIDPNTQFIIKSFIDYIAIEFLQKNSNKRNFSFNGQEVTDTAKASVGNTNYLIKRFSNHMIRLFDENDEWLEIDVKPVLREINSTYNLGIDLYYISKNNQRRRKNTQRLGKEVINKLNEKAQAEESLATD